MFNIDLNIASAVSIILINFYSIIDKLMKYILILNFTSINQLTTIIMTLTNILFNAFQNANMNLSIYNNSKLDTRVLITHTAAEYVEN